MLGVVATPDVRLAGAGSVRHSGRSARDVLRGSPGGAEMVTTSTPARLLCRDAMHGDGPLAEQSGSSPSYSSLAGLNVDVVPSLVVNSLGEPQQILKCAAPGLGACITKDFASIIVIVFDRLVTVKVTTPPTEVHDSLGKPPPVAVSTSLVGALAGDRESGRAL